MIRNGTIFPPGWKVKLIQLIACFSIDVMHNNNDNNNNDNNNKDVFIMSDFFSLSMKYPRGLTGSVKGVQGDN